MNHCRDPELAVAERSRSIEGPVINLEMNKFSNYEYPIHYPPCEARRGWSCP